MFKGVKSWNLMDGKQDEKAVIKNVNISLILRPWRYAEVIHNVLAVILGHQICQNTFFHDAQLLRNKRHAFALLFALCADDVNTRHECLTVRRHLAGSMIMRRCQCSPFTFHQLIKFHSPIAIERSLFFTEMYAAFFTQKEERNSGTYFFFFRIEIQLY
jgi:hypothetical protein